MMKKYILDIVLNYEFSTSSEEMIKLLFLKRGIQVDTQFCEDLLKVNELYIDAMIYSTHKVSIRKIIEQGSPSELSFKINDLSTRTFPHQVCVEQERINTIINALNLPYVDKYITKYDYYFHNVVDLIIHNHRCKITALLCLSNKVVVGYEDGRLLICDTHTGNVIKYLEGHTGAITCLTNLNSNVVSGSTDKSIRIWEPVPKILMCDAPVRFLNILEDKILSVTTHDQVTVWGKCSFGLSNVQCIDVIGPSIIYCTRNKVRTLNGYRINTIFRYEPSQNKILKHTKHLIILACCNEIHTYNFKSEEYTWTKIGPDIRLMEVGIDDTLIYITDNNINIHNTDIPLTDMPTQMTVLTDGRIVCGFKDGVLKIWK